MNRFLLQTKKLIFVRQKDMLSSALIISGMILASRIFGFVRYRTLTTYFTTRELDIFFAAFRIPDFIFEILITGALSSAFIPLFIKYKKNPESLYKNISTIINLIFIAMFFFVTAMIIFAPYIMPRITPGFPKASLPMLIEMSRLLLLFQLPFLVIGGVLSGIAQANRIFIATALAPIVYNISIIVGTIVLQPYFYLKAPVIGIIIGAFLYFVIQLPVLFITRFEYSPFILTRKIIREFFTLFSPRVLTVVSRQIDLTVDLSLSTLFGPGTYSSFYLSQQIQFFPVALIGMAFGQASLPYMTELFEKKQFDQVRSLFVDSLLQLLYLSIPFSVFCIFARTPIVRIIAGGRKFDWAATNLTALTVSIFALAIPIHTIFYFIVRSFYANHDTKTPFYINVFSIITNIALSTVFVMVFKLPVWSLAIAFSISITCNVILSLIFFQRQVHGLHYRRLLANTIKIYAVACLSAVPAYTLLRLFDSLIINTSRTLSLFFLVLFVSGVYFGVFVLFSWLFTVEEIYVLGRLAVRIHDLKRRLLEVYTESGS